MEQVIPGIWQLKVPIPNNPIGYVLPYLIEGPRDTYLLIDAGWNHPDSWQTLKDELVAAGAELRKLQRCVVTHVHPDHYGLAGRVREEGGAEIVLHERDKAFIESRYRHPEGLFPTINKWLLENGTPQDELIDLSEASMPVRRFVVPADPDSTLQGGEMISFGGFNLEVIWTPGHSPGHICFYERRQRLLISGDHVLPTITPNISLHPEQSGNPLLDYITSLRRLKTLDAQKALPAHEYMFENVQGRIEAIEEHHRERLDEMISMFDGQAKTGYQIAERTEWATGPFSGFNAWTKRAAIGETLAHLEYLVVDRRLERQHGEDGIVRFIPR
jgi:glyoxylase-like metal-dependent hydrolase (beta-lactamase superfamily II)